MRKLLTVLELLETARWLGATALDTSSLLLTLQWEAIALRNRVLTIAFDSLLLDEWEGSEFLPE